MTESQTPLAARSQVAATAAILLLFASDGLYMVESLFRPGGVDLGFTQDNAIYLLVRNGFVATAVLAAGAIGLGRRWLLVTAAVVGGMHTLIVFGMAVVQFVLGARLDFIVESLLLILCLLAVCAAVLLGFLGAARHRRDLTWAGVLLATAAAAAWSVAWFIHPFGGFAIPGSAIPFILLDVVLAVLVVLAAGMVGIHSAATRYAALAMAVALALWQFWRLPQSLAAPDLSPLFLVLRAALLVAAAVLAFLAARSVQRERQLP